jgi:uncharacterized membrane protein HdeD (DUF308 family)
MATSMQQSGPLVDFDILRRNRGWFLALGIVQIILGMIALGSSVFATIVSVAIFGWLLLIGGVLAIGHAFWERQWNGFFIDLLTGVLYAIVGFMIISNPVEAAVGLTLLIALFLLMGGIFRIVAALVGRFEHRGWLLLNGVITLLMGIMIWRQWPLSGLWVIGLFVGIEMIFYGWSLVMLGIAAKNLPRPAAKA